MQKDTQSKGVKSSVKPEGPADRMSQTKLYRRTGDVKSPSEAGVGKPSTPKTY